MVKPISPDEALTGRVVPEPVLLAVNQILREQYTGVALKVQQDDIVKLAMKLAKEAGNARFDPFKDGGMDFEPVYRQAGWDVEYDKPRYTEGYPATFTFSRRSR